VSKDAQKIKELWNPMYNAWFKGPDDPSIVLLRVDIHEAKYWESPSISLVHLAKYVAAAVTGGEVPLGQHGNITMH
jgi:general stress protein 26